MNNNNNNPYEVLGINENASMEEIKKAYGEYGRRRRRRDLFYKQQYRN